MTAQWYYAVQGRTEGPVTSDELRQRASRGEISAADLIWREGMSDWAPASSVGLATIAVPPPFPTVPSAQASTPGTAVHPSVAHQDVIPPPIGPSCIEPATRPAMVRGVDHQTTPGGETRTQQSRPAHRPTRTSPALRIVGWVTGVIAILVCAFWIGHVVGSKSHPENESELAVAGVSTPPDNPRPHDRKGGAGLRSDNPTLRGTTTGDASTPDASTPDASTPDASTPDATTPDATTPDIDKRDAITPDTDAFAKEPPGLASPPKPHPPKPQSLDPSVPVVPDPLGFPADPSPSSVELGAPAVPVNPASAELEKPSFLAPTDLPPSPLTASTTGGTPASTPARKDAGPRVLFQTLEIDRRPTFVVRGVTLSQSLRYRIISQLEIAARGADGSRKVVQVVQRTHLDHADDLSRATFAKSLGALEGQQYTFTLNEHHEVIKFAGPKKNMFSVRVTLPASQGFQLTSVIDEDGWKELTQFTFFQPDDGVAQGEPYVRQMSHDWTPLGTWSGTTTLKGQGVSGDLQSIAFRHALKYTPPVAKAADGPLGFRIVSADCTIEQADGTIEYDRKRQRVTTAREMFQVRGNVATELLGQPVNIQLREQQQMTIRITDQRPE